MDFGKGVLYLGVDDSNHAGTEFEGEIFVVTFSTNPFYVQRDIPLGKTRYDIRKIERLLSAGEIDYRATIRTSEAYKHSGGNVSIVGPTVISNYFKEMNLEGKIKECFVDIDGNLGRNNRLWLYSDLEHLGVDKLHIENFTKKWKNSQGQICNGYNGCRLVHISDAIAHKMFHRAKSIGVEEVEKQETEKGKYYKENMRFSKDWVLIS